VLDDDAVLLGRERDLDAVDEILQTGEGGGEPRAVGGEARDQRPGHDVAHGGDERVRAPELEARGGEGAAVAAEALLGRRPLEPGQIDEDLGERRELGVLLDGGPRDLSDADPLPPVNARHVLERGATLDAHVPPKP